MIPTVSVVVPFYNEADNVQPLVARIERAFDRHPDGYYECVLVDDGSTDTTPKILEDAANRNPAICPLYLARNYGQSAALVAGMRAARGRFVLTLDGDLQNDPEDFPKILELLESHDCVFGYRANRNDSWVRLLSSRVANRVRNAILQDGIRDSGCGIKGFRRACLDGLVAFNGVHRFLAVFMRLRGYRIVECPVTHHARHAGTSKYGINNRLWRGLYDLIGVAWLRRRLVFYETHTASGGEEDREKPGPGD